MTHTLNLLNGAAGSDANGAALSKPETSHDMPTKPPSYPTLLISLATGALVVFTALPLVSLLDATPPSGEVSPVIGILGLLLFVAVAALVNQASTTRAALGRCLLCIGGTITMIPAIVTFLFVLRTQAMVGSADSEAHVHSFGVALSLLGGVVSANALVWGMIIGVALFFAGRSLVGQAPTRA